MKFKKNQTGASMHPLLVETENTDGQLAERVLINS